MYGFLNSCCNALNQLRPSCSAPNRLAVCFDSASSFLCCIFSLSSWERELPGSGEGVGVTDGGKATDGGENRLGEGMSGSLYPRGLQMERGSYFTPREESQYLFLLVSGLKNLDSFSQPVSVFSFCFLERVLEAMANRKFPAKLAPCMPRPCTPPHLDPNFQQP